MNFYLFVNIIANFLSLVSMTIVRENNFMDRKFSKVTNAVKIDRIFQTFERMHLNNCVINCMVYTVCQSMNYNSVSKQCELSDRNSTTANFITAQLTWSHLESNSEQMEEPPANCTKIVLPLTTKSENTSEVIYNKTVGNINVSTSTEPDPTTPQKESVTAPITSPSTRHIVTTESTPSTNQYDTASTSTISQIDTTTRTTTELVQTTPQEGNVTAFTSSPPTSQIVTTESTLSTNQYDTASTSTHGSVDTTVSTSSTNQYDTSSTSTASDVVSTEYTSSTNQYDTSTDSDVDTTVSTFSTSRSSTEPSNTIDAMEILNKTINVPKFPPNPFTKKVLLSVCLWFSAEETKNMTALFNAVDNELPNELPCDKFLITLADSHIGVTVESRGVVFDKINISSNQYYHMCVVRDKGNATLYLRENNGVLHVEPKPNGVYTGSININEIVLGQQMDLNGQNNQCEIVTSDHCFTGIISGADVWFKALTIDEVESHYSITDAPLGDVINRNTFMGFAETNEIRATIISII